jgi:1-deoxy-D-xylulose-5-phosphate reductoisomerase
LTLAYECQEAGGSATCTLNAADEIAVEAFLQGKIGYLTIHEIVAETLSKMPVRWPRTIGEVLEIDRESRALARELTLARASAMTV